MAQLAIKGHATRGSEVITLLEMLGGKNIYNLTGTKEIWYILSDGTIEHSAYLFEEKGFTLEEFFERFPYKVGDKVTHNMGILMKIVRMYWDAECNVIRYDIQSPVDNNYKLKAMLAEHLQPYKEETMETAKITIAPRRHWNKDKIELDVAKGYEIKEENGKYYIIKKQLKYPKTFIEVLNFWHPNRQLEDDYQRCYKKDLIEKFQDLLYARDAYWKIASDWKPDFTNYDEERYGIYTATNKVVKDFCGVGDVNIILTFPTEEMRDAFYENFKDLIENVKELL